MQFVAGNDLAADLVVKLWYSQRDGYDFRVDKTSSSRIKKAGMILNRQTINVYYFTS